MIFLSQHPSNRGMLPSGAEAVRRVGIAGGAGAGGKTEGLGESLFSLLKGELMFYIST